MDAVQGSISEKSYHIMAIPGADNDGGGRRLASGGGKPGEGAEELGTADTDPDQGRGGQEDIRDFLQSGGTTGATVRGGDVGVDPTNIEGVGQLHAWGRAKDHGETAAERVGWEMLLPLSGGGHEGGGVYGNQEVNHK